MQFSLLVGTTVPKFQNCGGSCEIMAQGDQKGAISGSYCEFGTQRCNLHCASFECEFQQGPGMMELLVELWSNHPIQLEYVDM